MDTPKLDRRDRHDILEQLRALAASYVPEWRWDDREPDVGVILAHLYAAMMENTISLYNRSMHNHYLAFLNLLGTRLLPPSPAEGMISVGVTPGSEGVYIDRGTAVYAAAETDSGRVFYETTEAVRALDTELDRVFFTSAARDTIVCAYTRGGEEAPIRLFGFDAYPQLQRHILYFRDDAVFYTKDRTDLTLTLAHSRSAKQSEVLQRVFSDPETVSWEYHSGDGVWHTMDRVTRTAEGIRLEGDQGSQPVESEQEGAMGLLRCRLKKIPTGGLYLTDVGWMAEGHGLAPDALSTDGVELKRENFSPFGDALSIYTAFNLTNQEAFAKAGAVITIDFNLDYFKVPIEQVGMVVDLTNYRSIMTREDFASVRERDVRIERVLWEYWNGLGWARLFPDGSYEDFFTPSEEGAGIKRLTFRCPGDMAPLVLGAANGLYIRARIDKLSYMFSTAGNYIAPFVRSMTIAYRYDGEQVPCREILVESNVEQRRRSLPDDGQEALVTASLCPDPAMYLCFTGPLQGGPLRIFCDVEEGVFPDPPSLRWEYYGRTVNGEPGWKSIEVMDLTENLTRSAIVTLVGKPDFVKARFFGAEGYFLRLVDADGRYDSPGRRNHPVVRGIWPNTVPVVQRERRLPEYFYIARGEQNKRCALTVSNLAEVKVWVNEHGALSVKEEEQFLHDPAIQVKRSAEGAVTEVWVPWHEVDRLEAAGRDERAFVVDYAEGAVVFGDGHHGRIPPDGAEETIMVRYIVCDGSFGNIPPHAILGFASRPVGVTWVTNRKSIGGGADMETIDEAARRRSGELLGMGRIVTLEDFQRSVLSSNRNICRVKCAAHVDRYNRPAEGRLAVAVLLKEYRQGGELFDAVVRSARELIAEKASMLLGGKGQVDIFEVRYVEIFVVVDAVIADYNIYHETHQAISRRLAEFLDPITGNFNGQGWEIGQLPGRELIYNSIKTVKNIKWIKGLHMFTYVVTEQGRQAVEFDQIRRDAFTVPVCGEPEINLTVEQTWG